MESVYVLCQTKSVFKVLMKAIAGNGFRNIFNETPEKYDPYNEYNIDINKPIVIRLRNGIVYKKMETYENVLHQHIMYNQLFGGEYSWVFD